MDKVVTSSNASGLQVPSSSLRSYFLELPAEIRLLVYKLILANVSASLTFVNLGARVRYQPRTAPVILHVCRLIYIEAFPILQRGLKVTLPPLHMRVVQQRTLYQGLSADMAHLVPVLTWVRHICFHSEYSMRNTHPILAGCRGLRSVTLPAYLRTGRNIWRRVPGRTEERLCACLAAAARVALARYTGLGERVQSASAVVVRRADDWAPHKIEITVHIGPFDELAKPPYVSCPCLETGWCNFHRHRRVTSSGMSQACPYCRPGRAHEDPYSDSGFNYLARILGFRGSWSPLS